METVRLSAGLRMFYCAVTIISYGIRGKAMASFGNVVSANAGSCPYPVYPQVACTPQLLEALGLLNTGYHLANHSNTLLNQSHKA